MVVYDPQPAPMSLVCAWPGRPTHYFPNAAGLRIPYTPACCAEDAGNSASRCPFGATLGLTSGGNRMLFYAVAGTNAPAVLPAAGVSGGVPPDRWDKPSDSTFFAAFTSRSISRPQDPHR